jgi:hypothetical protein
MRGIRCALATCSGEAVDMRDGRAFGVVIFLFVLSTSACTSSSPGPSRFLSATSAPSPTSIGASSPTTAVFTPSATQTYSIGATSPTDAAPTPSATDTVTAWTGTMNSSSNYTVTAQDGGLVCSATWTTALKFTVAADSTVSGTATSTLEGTPVCTHPEYFTMPATTMTSTISGIASATQLLLQLNQVAYEPAGSIDATGMSASIYGINTAPSRIAIPITSPGHAAGSQQLQTISAVNSYTSENTITLDCLTC